MAQRRRRRRSYNSRVDLSRHFCSAFHNDWIASPGSAEFQIVMSRTWPSSRRFLSHGSIGRM
jgi:hypothetical protein